MGIKKTNINSIDKLTSKLKLNIRQFVKIAKNSSKYYRPFDLKKKFSTKWRHIDNPTAELKEIQKRINKLILRDYILQLPPNIIGGVKDKTIIDNAKIHVNQEMVLTLDIKDCYPNTSNSRIYDLWKNILGFDPNSSRILTQLTTHNGHLPQGSSASPSLSNLALLQLFEEINTYANKHSLNFTMYVDDITISGKYNDVTDSISKLISIIQKYGYQVRNKKIKKMPSRVTQITTGVKLNNGISVSKNKIDEVRKNIINLANLRKPYITKMSILGKIDQIKKLSEEKAEYLTNFANMLLPNNIDLISTNPEKDQIINCDGKKCKAN